MERTTKITNRFFQLVTILLLASGFALVRSWLGVIIVLIMVSFWWITRRVKRKKVSWIRLVIFVGVAAYGLINNVSSYLMVAGVATALASWEMEDQIPNAADSITLSARSFEKSHLRILGVAFSTGFILAEAGLFLHFSLPFWVVFLATILVLFCIFQLSRLFKKV